MAAKNKKEKSASGTNYLLLLLGGLFIIAIAVIVAYALAIPPLQGCVGVVEVKGPIITEDIDSTLFSDEVIGSETIAQQIESAGSRSDVKSVLVLVDSPGGSVVASKEIYDALRAIGKPKVAYINELAASGGYYVAAGTDYIIAQPDAITGSIGARATFADMSGLFAKIGYNETTVKSGAMKDIGSSSRPMTQEELSVIESIVNESFQEFKSAVEAGRGERLDKSLFKAVLDARILTGRQAKKIGLVDFLGNKKSAISKAAELGGLDSSDPRTCELTSSKGEKSLFGSLSIEALDFLVKGMGAPRLLYQ